MGKIMRQVEINGVQSLRWFDDETQIKLFEMWGGHKVFHKSLQSIDYTIDIDYKTRSLNELEADLFMLAEFVNSNRSVYEIENEYEKVLWEIGEEFKQIKQNLTTKRGV